jgi:hypothetical protein
MKSLTERPTSIDQIPLVLNARDIAVILGLSVDYIQHNPANYGLSRRMGKALRVTRPVFLRKMGLEVVK